MLIIAHRINRISQLAEVPHRYGVEVDVRAYMDDLVLNHEPFETGDSLDEYIKNFSHAFIIFNIKEAGIEKRVIETAKRHGIENYFLLDVEAYWIHHATERGFKKIAVRYSENEPLQSALVYKGRAEWLWIDIPTKLPLSEEIVSQIREFRTCLVCPERWNRPHEIQGYIDEIKSLDFKLDAVMTSLKHAEQWEELGRHYQN
ncbi:MAG TPA: hypothetical protein VGE35_01515 [Candidatus Paceibacterota bacterium]